MKKNVYIKRIKVVAESKTTGARTPYQVVEVPTDMDDAKAEKQAIKEVSSGHRFEHEPGYRFVCI